MCQLLSTVVNEQWIFFVPSSILKWKTGGVIVKEFEFEQNVQSKRNDAIDSGIGFGVSFVFFTAIFVIGTVIEVLGK